MYKELLYFAHSLLSNQKVMFKIQLNRYNLGSYFSENVTCYGKLQQKRHTVIETCRKHIISHQGMTARHWSALCNGTSKKTNIFSISNYAITCYFQTVIYSTFDLRSRSATITKLFFLTKVFLQRALRHSTSQNLALKSP